FAACIWPASGIRSGSPSRGCRHWRRTERAGCFRRDELASPNVSKDIPSLAAAGGRSMLLPNGHAEAKSCTVSHHILLARGCSAARLRIWSRVAASLLDFRPASLSEVRAGECPDGRDHWEPDMLRQLFAPQLVALYVLIGTTIYVHFRGKQRLRFARQLGDPS